MRKPSMCIVGPGRFGSALALALCEAGYPVREIVARDRPESLVHARAIAKPVKARAAILAQASFDSDVTWLCVPDRQIEGVALTLATNLRSASGLNSGEPNDGASREMSSKASRLLASDRRQKGRARDGVDWPGKTVFHASGALTSEILAPLANLGAKVASVHPMMTFVEEARPSLTGVSFAVEGEPRAARMAESIVRGLKGVLIKVQRADKPLYHAWGAFSSPLLICLLSVADRIAAELKLSSVQARRTLGPILRQTIENYIAKGPAAAFSGPMVRGDVETVRAHLAELSRVQAAREVYMALARAGISSLPVGEKEEIERVLSEPGKRVSSSERRALKIGGIIQPY